MGNTQRDRESRRGYCLGGGAVSLSAAPAADHAYQVGRARHGGHWREHSPIQELDAHRFRILVGEHTDRADQEDEDQQIEDSQHLHSPVLVRAVARTTL